MGLAIFFHFASALSIEPQIPYQTRHVLINGIQKPYIYGESRLAIDGISRINNKNHPLQMNTAKPDVTVLDWKEVDSWNF